MTKLDWQYEKALESMNHRQNSIEWYKNCKKYVKWVARKQMDLVTYSIVHLLAFANIQTVILQPCSQTILSRNTTHHTKTVPLKVLTVSILDHFFSSTWKCLRTGRTFETLLVLLRAISTSQTAWDTWQAHHNYRWKDHRQLIILVLFQIRGVQIHLQGGSWFALIKWQNKFT